MNPVYISIGSNLDQPQQQVSTALQELANIAQSKLICHSSLYRNPPLGPQDQPDFINAVAKLETDLSAEQLLQQLLTIEEAHGRKRGGERWGPRPLDLDILLYSDHVIQTASLTIPHYALRERYFFLYPLAEIDENVCLPSGESIKQLLAQCLPCDLETICSD